MNWLLIIILGAIAGSFINMASYRLSLRNKNIKELILAPSFCIKCKHKLGIKNLFPIFSFIFQKGKCSFCSVKIPIRYLLIEIFCVVSFALIFFFMGENLDAKLTINLLIFLALLTMIITDLEHYFISDFNQIILFILVIFYHFLNNNLEQYSYYLFSAFAYLAFGFILNFVFKFFAKKDGIGIDDIKFFAIVGFMIGIKNFPFFMFLSGILGIVFGLIWQRLQKDDTFPFAPALIVSLILVINFDFGKYIY